jgi:hypothetical protein
LEEYGSVICINAIIVGRCMRCCLLLKHRESKIALNR